MEDEIYSERSGYEGYDTLFEKINRIQGRTLEWTVEPKDNLKKVILTDKARKYRQAIYVNKDRKDTDALTDLLRDYCFEHSITY